MIGMRIEREYRRFEDIDEIRVYDCNDYYRHAPKKFDVEELPIQELIKNIPIDVHILIPYEDGKDFIIQDLGSFTLDMFNFSSEDVEGRLLSEVSPLYFDMLYDDFMEVYTNRTTKKIRFVYYKENKVSAISNTSIFFDMERLFITNDNILTNRNKPFDTENNRFDEDKSNMLESFSQTGSYHKINGKYTWSQGIYNIINRGKEKADDYYNIVFDLVIPEDKYIVDEIFNITNKETSHFEEIIRIRTDDGILKFIEVNIYSYFDESGIIIRQGLMNDITQIHQREYDKPVDFILDGFKNSKKLALLIEPLNKNL